MKAKTPGTKNNTASVDSATNDPNPANDSDSATTRVFPSPPKNKAPVAENDRYVMNEGGVLSARKPGILINDSDPDKGDRLEAVLISEPKHGGLKLENNGSFTYRPERNYNGPDTFVYEACDGSGGCSRKATVSITIRPVGG